MGFGSIFEIRKGLKMKVIRFKVIDTSVYSGATEYTEKDYELW